MVHMQTAILLANIGNSDLGKNRKAFLSNKDPSFQGNFYEESKKLLESGNFHDLELLLLDPTITKISESYNLKEIILFGTEQDNYKDQDTKYAALIVKEIISRRYDFPKDRIKVVLISKNPVEYEKILRVYSEEIGKIPQDFDQIFVSTTGGTPQQSLSLALQASQKYSEKVKMIYKPRTSEEAIISEVVFKEKKEVAKIGTVQIDFELSTDSFPPEITNKEKTKEKIFKALDIAYQNKVNVICLPELCMHEEWLSDIESRYPLMTVVAGSYYDNRKRNVCKIVTNSCRNILPPQFKIIPSDFENQVCGEGEGMVSGEVPNIYEETPYGIFSVLICRDFGNFCFNLEKEVDLIFVPSYNPANQRFHTKANQRVEDNPSYIIISNAAKFGGTSIFGRMRNTFYPELVNKGCKQKGDTTFKLCEFKEGEEGIIFADFNLKHKWFMVPAPLDPKKDIKPVENIVKIPF